MNLDAQTYLNLVEHAQQIAMVDIEATGLKGDYNSIICVAFKAIGQPAYTFSVKRPGDDKKLVAAVKDQLERYLCWVTYYGKGFDMKDINTRLFYHGMLPVEPRHHIDLYWQLKTHLLMSRRSQAHYLRWIDSPEQKMGVSPEAWNKVLADPKRELPLLQARCESDVVGLEQLYTRTRHLIRDIKR
jgi:uncharacterized protein YprB with RNaseH-like and TPR domain